MAGVVVQGVVMCSSYLAASLISLQVSSSQDLASCGWIPAPAQRDNLIRD